jgi:hypothetical protein
MASKIINQITEKKLHFYPYLKLDCIVKVVQIMHILKNDYKTCVNFSGGNATDTVPDLSFC